MISSQTSRNSEGSGLEGFGTSEFGSVSKIEFAKRLKGLRDVVSPDQFKQIKEQLISHPQIDVIDNAIRGLSEEDEFALMCRLMGTTTHMVHLEQNPIIRGDYIVPDFLAQFTPGCGVYGIDHEGSPSIKGLIEVKSTSKRRFKIGGSRLTRLRNFADQFELPLFFAVRFTEFESSALWVMCGDDDRSRTTLTIRLEDLTRSERHVLWDEYLLMLRPSVYFRAVYDPDADPIGIRHLEHGNLCEFDIITEDRAIRLHGSDASLAYGVFQGFHLREAERTQEGNKTARIYTPTMLAAFLADLIYKPNLMISTEFGNTIFNASRVLALSDQESRLGLFDRNLIESVTGFFCNEDILFVLAFEEPKDHYDRLLRYSHLPVR